MYVIRWFFWLFSSSLKELFLGYVKVLYKNNLCFSDFKVLDGRIATHSYNTRNSEDITTFQSRTKTLKFSFFSCSIVEWNKLDLKIRNSSYLVFRNYLLKRISPLAAPVYNIHNPLGLKLLTRLRLGLSHLNEHRFNHNFESCLNPLCTCSLEVESTTHFFLHCHHFNAIRIALNNSLKGIDNDILKLSDSSLTKVILFGDSKYSDFQNHDILNSTITFIIDSKRFDCSLL